MCVWLIHTDHTPSLIPGVCVCGSGNEAICRLLTTYVEHGQSREELDVLRQFSQEVTSEDEFGEVCLLPPSLVSSAAKRDPHAVCRRVDVDTPHSPRDFLRRHR